MKLPVWRIALPLLASQLFIAPLLWGAHKYDSISTEDVEDEDALGLTSGTQNKPKRNLLGFRSSTVSISSPILKPVSFIDLLVAETGLPAEIFHSGKQPEKETYLFILDTPIVLDSHIFYQTSHHYLIAINTTRLDSFDSLEAIREKIREKTKKKKSFVYATKAYLEWKTAKDPKWPPNMRPYLVENSHKNTDRTGHRDFFYGSYTLTSRLTPHLFHLHKNDGHASFVTHAWDPYTNEMRATADLSHIAPTKYEEHFFHHNPAYIWKELIGLFALSPEPVNGSLPL